MDGNFDQSGSSHPQHVSSFFQGIPESSRVQQSSSSPSTSRACPTDSQDTCSPISIWAGDLDAYMDETFLRQAVMASGWGHDITRIKVVRDHYTGVHSGYGFLDAASLDAAHRVISVGSGMPIPGTNRCWRLKMGRNAAGSAASSSSESNVYVGNLEQSVTDYQLMTAFRPRYASVRHAKVVCNEYGQSRCFGFVRFSNSQEAEQAVCEMNGYMLNQKPIRLSPAAGRTRGAPRAQAGRGDGTGTARFFQVLPVFGTPTNKRPRQLMAPDDPNNTTLFIGGTGSHLTEDLLWREFTAFGEVDAVRIPVNKTGFAFVRFRSRECAERAKDEVNHSQVPTLHPTKPVRVEWAAEQIQNGKSSSPISQPPHARPAPQDFILRSQSGGEMAEGEGIEGQSLHSAEPTERIRMKLLSSEDTVHSSDGCQPFMQGSGSKSPLEADMASGPVGNLSNCGDDVDQLKKSRGDNEPPSKRAAVGRPEYAVDMHPSLGASGRELQSGGVENNKSTVGGNRSKDEPSAMQFTWLNASVNQDAPQEHD